MSMKSPRATSISDRAASLLRRIFVEDWSLKLLALTITLALWFFVSSRQSQREVLVEPRIEGKPAPTFQVKEIVVTPSKIKVQGPANRLSAINKVTLPISVEGRRESFDERGTALPMSDPNVEPLDTVNIHVTIVASENPNNKSLSVN